MPDTLFAPARGARLAYQVFGEGDETIVGIPPLAQNIEICWEQPLVRAMLERFGSFSRFVHFDKRGTGASGRRSRVPGLDERVDDIRAVMDAAGIDRAHLFVQSDGGPMAILFAATYPERVQSLMLFGAFAHNPPGMQGRELEERMDIYVSQWGTAESPIVDGFAPSLAADQEFRTWHQRYERHAADSESLRELLELSFEMDVREVLGSIEAPTLVLHRTGDRIIPLERGVELAEGIPGARLIEFDSEDHFAYVGDVDSWMTEIERFVTGSATPRHEVPPRGAVRIVTLGRFSVERDGVEVETSEWGSRLARQLCKRLVTARGWPTTRDELFEMLWPGEYDRAKLGPRLSVQLSAVRRILGGGVIADRDSVRLDLSEVSTDLETFYKATDDAAIVAAWTGELLPEDLYEDWTTTARNEARARFMASARRLAAAAVEAGDHMRAAELARRIVEADRFDDGAYRLLVGALIGAGEIGPARAAHADWAEAMRELDIVIPAFDAGEFS